MSFRPDRRGVDGPAKAITRGTFDTLIQDAGWNEPRASCGCRRNKIRSRRWEDVDLEAGELRLRDRMAASRTEEPLAASAPDAQDLQRRMCHCRSRPATRAITPATLELVGHELVRKGEALFLLQVRSGALELMPVSWWDVYGSYLPESWEFQITLTGPDETYTMRVRGERLIHARYGRTPTEP